MRSTRLSLLRHARDGEDQAWNRLVKLYTPWVYRWLTAQGFAHHDAEELTQDVMAVVVRELDRFEHSGRTGAFRRWLKEITVYRAKAFWRARNMRAKAPGGSAFLAVIDQLADANSEVAEAWDREHDQHVLRSLLAEIERDFEPSTMQAFRMLAFEGRRADAVATELEMTVGSVYSAKSRVMRRLRQQAEGLVDEDLLS